MTDDNTLTQPSRTAPLDVERLRRDFPVLDRTVHGQPLVYLDNAATTQKPQAVIDAVAAFYTGYNANIHRGVHRLSIEATEAYERARGLVQRFLGAESPREIVFTRGATEGINLVADSLGRRRLSAGDEVLITHLEHHSNIVPWQILCQRAGATLRAAPIDDDGDVIFEEFEKLLNSRTRIVAMAHVSNALGTVNPVGRMIEAARRQGAVTLVDGAQAVGHLPVNVRELGCDFYVLSAHKAFGPTGAGALYGRLELLEEMPPYQSGGEMIKSVSFERTVYNDVPHKFEAGTPNIAGAIGMGAAIEFLNGIGLDRIAAYEHDLLGYAEQELAGLPELRLIGTARERASVLSFVIEGIDPHDAAGILDQEGIAVRSGHHCAQPVMERFGLPATVRASLAFYNTKGEIDALVTALGKVLDALR